MSRFVVRLGLCLFFVSALCAAAAGPQPGLEIVKSGKVAGACPLTGTDVRVGISGSVARVNVVQEFANTSPEKIEAIYVFPLPENAAVDDMTITVGNRTIKGEIKKREEARAIFDQARRENHTAALLDQERPNIFTQSVTNIMPGDEVTVSISYVQTVKYDTGSYEFVFPTVVGPRYIPGQPTSTGKGGGREPDTDQVPDASRITPPITPKGTHAGHDFSIAMAIDAGVAIHNLRSPSHEITIAKATPNTATVKLKNTYELPNKDFILRYSTAASEITDGVLAHSDGNGGGYFSLILQPPERFPEFDVQPKEIVFVLDTSGSMMGFPIEKAKEVIDHALAGLYPTDTFNLIAFSGDTNILFDKPVYPTAENLAKARTFLSSQRGYGGTEMMKAIKAALDPSDSQNNLRIACFLTDGEVGNDMQILAEVQKHPNARVFSFGIGTSVNRFLLSNMAREGRGEADFVTLPEKAEAAAKRFYERIHSPLLTDVSVEFQGLKVADVYPERIPDVFAASPVIVTGRYTGAGQGKVILRGKRAGAPYSREIPVDFSADGKNNEVLASLWARTKIDELMSEDWIGMQLGRPRPEIGNEITSLGLKHHLMTQFTSFVAVEERVVTTGGTPHKVEVPVEMPEGVAYEGIFGADQRQPVAVAGAYMLATQPQGFYGQPAKAQKMGAGGGGGIGSGSGAGYGGGVLGGIASAKAAPTAPPPPPPGYAGMNSTVNVTASAETVEIRTDAAHVKVPLSPERRGLEAKLSPDVLKAFDCTQHKQQQCAGVQQGKLKVVLVLGDASAGVLKQLKALGVQLGKQHGTAVEAELDPALLTKLAAMQQVKFVTLQKGS